MVTSGFALFVTSQNQNYCSREKRKFQTFETFVSLLNNNFNFDHAVQFLAI